MAVLPRISIPPHSSPNLGPNATPTQQLRTITTASSVSSRIQRALSPIRSVTASYANSSSSSSSISGNRSTSRVRGGGSNVPQRIQPFDGANSTDGLENKSTCQLLGSPNNQILKSTSWSTTDDETDKVSWNCHSCLYNA